MLVWLSLVVWSSTTQVVLNCVWKDQKGGPKPPGHVPKACPHLTSPNPPLPPHPFFPLTIGRTRPSPSTTIAALLHDIAAELPHFSIRALAASYVAQKLAIHVQFFLIILPTLSPESDIRFYSEGFGPRKLLIRFHHQDFRQTKFRGFSGFLCSQPQRNCKFFCFHLVLKRDNIFF